MCGGASSTGSSWATTPGLSPRVRGSQPRLDQRDAGHGSIPACAGEPPSTGPTSTLTRVYPRVCGGARDRDKHLMLVPGLSPRVRGSPGRRLDAVAPRGSIPACAGEPDRGEAAVHPPRVYPACAGEPSGWSGCLPASRVYPRVCGGAFAECEPLEVFGGLSPRVRGSRVVATASRVRIRSIPACAGEPRTEIVTQSAVRVYPRVCGGARSSRRISSRGLGLSPRVRGSRAGRGQGHIRPGSIPACAGEPKAEPRLTAIAGVYPRVCGGAHHRPPPMMMLPGLSPRVRGSHGRPPPRAVYPGSIPACAGEPARTAAAAIRIRVYPRVCGGAAGIGRPWRYPRGLSPRVRGSPRRRT